MPDFFIELVDSFIREPSTDEERKAANARDYNPVENLNRGVISSWFPKKGKSKRNIGSDIAGRIYAIRDCDKFIATFEKKASFDQCRAISKQLNSFHFDTNEENCFEVCSRIFEELLNKRINGGNEVGPEDIGDAILLGDTDIIFLQEVGNKCPLCSKKLIVTKKAKKLAQYRIVNIFPTQLNDESLQEFESIKKAPGNPDADGNKIPLCLNCAASYEGYPETDEYRKLLDVKRNAVNIRELDDELARSDLENEIIKVVRRIADKGSFGMENVEPEMSPAFVKEKIPEPLTLQNKVIFLVQCYYKVIQEEFSSLQRVNDFDYNLVCSQVKSAYYKIKKRDGNREHQFNAMVGWMQQELHLSEDERTACECMVAFFVQSCEVFEKVEIAK